MALSEATSVVPPNPETPSTNHAHSNQGSLPSSPDPDPTPSDLDHAVLDELQKLDLKEPVEEGDGEPDELQKLDSTEKVEEDGVGELQKLDLKEEEDEAGELQTLDLKEEEGGEGEEEEEKSSGERESDGGGGEGWGGNQGWEEDGGEVEEKKAEETQESNRRYQYPVRPEAEDCSYYLKTGSCKFGSNCKFNHPVSRKTNQRFGGVILGFWGKRRGVWSQRVGACFGGLYLSLKPLETV
ncbi:hypothetical protein DVH24_021322 [Malus domestica]|uniref:C3H1-type domain-containing protein n=1 Tax=Malus domestica TaxID=3750 RepID=A0A498KV37_MALDO|nr:hypothetical protein DVH24_004458 [Malus domestica]RXI09585.1 hypothetical protein DVH24_032741 [Malus domestica]RXI09641.1 hypothetical protein DVH24_021322 [Malus domestica]